jgi:hypothetical protein
MFISGLEEVERSGSDGTQVFCLDEDWGLDLDETFSYFDEVGGSSEVFLFFCHFRLWVGVLRFDDLEGIACISTFSRNEKGRAL